MRALNTSLLRVLSQIQLSSWVQTHECSWEASSWRKSEGRFFPSCSFSGAVPLAPLTAAPQLSLCLLSHHPGLHPGPDLLAQLQTPPTHRGLGKSLLRLWPWLLPNPDSSLSALALCCDGHLPCDSGGLPANLHWRSSQICLPHSNTSIKAKSFNQQEKMKKIQRCISTRCQRYRNCEDKQVSISIIYATTIWDTTSISANTVGILSSL